jgi:hypothetical protein
MSSDEGIIVLQPQKDSTETSLAAILQSQFIELNMEPILKATEIREHEVMSYTAILMSQFVNEILSVRENNLTGAMNVEEANYIKRKLAMQKAINEDPNVMVWLIENTWARFFGILRQSLNRQSRKEGVDIATAAVIRAAESERLNIGQRFLAKLGVGKYRVNHRRKDE